MFALFFLRASLMSTSFLFCRVFFHFLSPAEHRYHILQPALGRSSWVRLSHPTAAAAAGQGWGDSAEHPPSHLLPPLVAEQRQGAGEAQIKAETWGRIWSGTCCRSWMMWSDVCHCVRLKPCRQGPWVAWLFSYIHRVTHAGGNHSITVPSVLTLPGTAQEAAVWAIMPIISIFNHNVPLFLEENSPDS